MLQTFLLIRKISMKQKDLNELCTVVSILTQSKSLFETMDESKNDIPEEIRTDFDYMYYDLKNFIVDIGNYRSKKEDIILSVCNSEREAEK